MRIRTGLSLLFLLLAASQPQAADLPKPKFGADATPLTKDHGFLGTSAAPDYWALAPFYVPQQTSSACSLASITMAVNALTGLPSGAEDKIVTQAGLLELVASKTWAAQAAEGGDGVLFADLVEQTKASLKALGLSRTVTAAQPAKDPSATLDALRTLLAANEADANDIVLVYFNQGVVTGDWNGPHVSPIGAYDAANDRVLIMDVDRDWYVPYWTKTETLFKAFLKPAPEDQGVLKGETGGWVHIAKG